MLPVVLASILTFVQLPQAPVALAAARTTVDAVAVRGTTELSLAEAYDAARAVAIERVQERWAERGHRELVERRPIWLPQFCAEHALRRWLDRQSLETALQIVDREDQVHEHEFGSSYQTTLWIAEDQNRVAQTERQLRRELAAAERRTLVAAGSTVGVWALLGIAIGWLDRLSRGYMTGRLRLIGLLLGAAVPCLAFLL